MATVGPKPLALLLVLLISFSLLLVAKARPLNAADNSLNYNINVAVESEKLYVANLKVVETKTGAPTIGVRHKLLSGPSPVDQSGPSPGEGH